MGVYKNVLCSGFLKTGKNPKIYQQERSTVMYAHIKWKLKSKTEGRRRWVDRRWDGWTASPTQWTWGGETYGRWWRTGKPRVLQSMGFQRIRHDLAIEQQWKREDLFDMAPKRQTQTQNDKEADLSSKEGRISISMSCHKMQSTEQWTLCHDPPRTQGWMEEDFLDQEEGGKLDINF